MLCKKSLPRLTVVKDLGILVDAKLKFDIHVNNIVSRAHQRANCIFRCFLSRDVEWLMRAFLTYVRPLVEYASPVWNPTAITLIDKLERVQRRFTKRLPGYGQLSYGQRLKQLNLRSLQYRRLVADLSFCYKIFHNLVDVSAVEFFTLIAGSITRGHSYKLFQQHCRVNARAHFFVNRVTRVWNSLPPDVVTAENITVFKRRLASCNLTSYCRLYE